MVKLKRTILIGSQEKRRSNLNDYGKHFLSFRIENWKIYVEKLDQEEYITRNLYKYATLFFFIAYIRHNRPCSCLIKHVDIGKTSTSKRGKKNSKKLSA